MAPKHDPFMTRMRRRLRRLKREEHLADERGNTRKVSRIRKATAGVEFEIAKRQARRRDLGHVSVLDGTPTALGLKLVLLDARRSDRWDGVLNSGDRRSIIAGLLHRLSKKTQDELYKGWIRKLPGYYPANPPTQGTHLRLGDGTVGSVGEHLEWWQQGLDTSFGPELRRGLILLGYYAYQPYGNEEWHTNLKRNPHDRLIERGMV